MRAVVSSARNSRPKSRRTGDRRARAQVRAEEDVGRLDVPVDHADLGCGAGVHRGTRRRRRCRSGSSRLHWLLGRRGTR